MSATLTPLETLDGPPAAAAAAAADGSPRLTTVQHENAGIASQQQLAHKHRITLPCLPLA
jgi:hypothetical protein